MTDTGAMIAVSSGRRDSSVLDGDTWDSAYAGVPRICRQQMASSLQWPCCFCPQVSQQLVVAPLENKSIIRLRHHQQRALGF